MDKLLYVPNPLLRQKADKIQSVGVKEKEIAKKMMQIMIKAPGVGLAANQIGILKQIVTIFFVDQETKIRSTSDDDQPLTDLLNIGTASDAKDNNIKDKDDDEWPSIKSLCSNNDESSTPPVKTTLKKPSDDVGASLVDSSSDINSSIPETEWPSIARMELHDNTHDVKV